MSATSTKSNFVDAIRMADIKRIKEILNDNSADIVQYRISFNATMKLNLTTSKECDIPTIIHNSDNLVNVRCIVTPIHIAIIAAQEAVVEEIFEHVMSKYYTGDPDSLKKEVHKILDQKTKVEFQGGPSIYSEDDRMLDGINSIYLATRFSPQSLYKIYKMLKRIGSIGEEELKSLLEEKDPHCGTTPLYTATDAEPPNYFATW